MPAMRPENWESKRCVTRVNEEQRKPGRALEGLEILE